MAKPPLRQGAYDNSPREPMEVLAMLAGKTSYTVPTEGKGTSNSRLDAADVAHALGTVPDKLGATLALAMACGRDNLFTIVHDQGIDRLREYLTLVPGHAEVLGPGRAFRIHLVLKDVFEDLLFPRRHLSMSSAALAYAMRANDYRWLHEHITGFCRDLANHAARLACCYLFASDKITVPPRASKGRMATAADQVIARAHAKIAAAECRIDVLAMVENWTPRAPGLLTLDGVMLRPTDLE